MAETCFSIQHFHPSNNEPNWKLIQLVTTAGYPTVGADADTIGSRTSRTYS